MAAITESYTADDAAVRALQAGADMVLMPDDFELAYQGVLKAVQDGVIPEEQINESLKRIYRVKFRNRIDAEGNVVDVVPGSAEGESGAEEGQSAEGEPDGQTAENPEDTQQ